MLANTRRINNMKIAAVTEDGITISQHFGRAPYYVVVTIADGKVVSKEVRDKVGHAQFASEHQEEHHPAGQENDPRGHGFDPAAQNRHARMVAVIQDCDILLARGMGAGAYSGLAQANIRPILTDIPTIDEAVQAVLRGDIVNHPEKLH
jgi:predicted Fe-Mo cluster-binding NifX family protein